MSERDRLETTAGGHSSVRAHISRSGPPTAPHHGKSSLPATVIPKASPIAMPVAVVMDQVETIILRKHEDYGGDNITSSPFGPMAGVLVRMHDKLARLVNLIENDKHPNYESVEDSLYDMIGYSVIGCLIARGEWPGVKKP